MESTKGAARRTAIEKMESRRDSEDCENREVEKPEIPGSGQTESADEDFELVRRCREGDDRAFEALVQKYQQTLFNLIFHNIGHHAEVEDIAQKIFSKIYFSLEKFDNSRPFFPWIYRIAINQCYDELRRLRRRKSLTFSELNLEETESIESLLNRQGFASPPVEERKELHSILFKLLDQLPDKQRMALVLRDLQDVPYDKMARILKCSEQAARLKVFRARARLRDLMNRTLRKERKPRR